MLLLLLLLLGDCGGSDDFGDCLLTRGVVRGLVLLLLLICSLDLLELVVQSCHDRRSAVRPVSQCAQKLLELPGSQVTTESVLDLELFVLLVKFRAEKFGIDSIDDEILERSNRGNLEKGHELIVREYPSFGRERDDRELLQLRDLRLVEGR